MIEKYSGGKPVVPRRCGCCGEKGVTKRWKHRATSMHQGRLQDTEVQETELNKTEYHAWHIGSCNRLLSIGPLVGRNSGYWPNRVWYRRARKIWNDLKHAENWNTEAAVTTDHIWPAGQWYWLRTVDKRHPHLQSSWVTVELFVDSTPHAKNDLINDK